MAVWKGAVENTSASSSVYKMFAAVGLMALAAYASHYHFVIRFGVCLLGLGSIIRPAVADSLVRCQGYWVLPLAGTGFTLATIFEMSWPYGPGTLIPINQAPAVEGLRLISLCAGGLGLLMWTKSYLGSLDVLKYLVAEHESGDKAQLRILGQAREIAKLKSMNETILDSVPMGFMATNPSGHIIHVNASFLQITNTLMSGVMDRLPQELFPGSELATTLVELPKRSLRTPQVEELRGQPMGYGPEALRVTAAHSQEGHIVFVVEDVSAKVKAEEEEKRFQSLQIESEKLRVLSGLYSGVAHDLNDTLGILTGYTELLANRGTDMSLSLRAIPLMRKAAGRCRKIVETIREFTSDRFSHSDACHLHGIIDEALELFAKRFKSGSIEVIRKYDEVPDSHVNRQQLLQVFFNLLNLHYMLLRQMEGVRSITVACSRHGGEIRVSISSSAPVWSEDLDDYLSAPLPESGGPHEETGLVLFVSHGIFKAHHGDLAIDRRQENASIVCSISIVGEEEVRENSSADVLPKEILAGKTILVVEDELANVEIFREHVGEAGATVHFCLRGADALDRMKETPYDLITLDVLMPEMGGREIFTILKEERLEVIHRIAFITAATSDETILEFIRESGRPVLFKPYTLDQLDTFLADVFTSFDQ